MFYRLELTLAYSRFTNRYIFRNEKQRPLSCLNQTVTSGSENVGQCGGAFHPRSFSRPQAATPPVAERSLIALKSWGKMTLLRDL